MKATLLLGLLASTSFASARIHPGTHALALAASLISGPLPALAKPVWRFTSTRLSPRQANSTTSAATGTYTVVSGDTLNAIAATEGTTAQALEDANPGVEPTDLQVGQVLTMPSSASSNGTSSSTSDPAPAAMESNSADASELGDGLAASGSAKATGTATATAPKSSTSGCGGHHHHHNSTGTAGGTAKAQNGTTHTGHHSHNGTKADEHAHNSTSISAESGECNATSHHRHNGTDASGTATAASFFIPATATASALAVALTSPATAGDVVAKALNGFAAMLHRA